MLVNWNLLVSAVKLVSFERVTCSFEGVTCSFVSVTCRFVSVTCSFVGVTCSFVGVTCSFDPITFRFVIPKWWILHTYSAEVQLKRGGGGGGGGKAGRISDKFVLILHDKNDKNDFLQTQRIKQLDKYSISIKYSYLRSSTNRKLFHAFVYVL